MQYQISILFTISSLEQIDYAGQQLTLVKNAAPMPSQNGNLAVACVAFQPLVENRVSWVDDYNIYATTAQLEVGAIIPQTWVTSVAQPGCTYAFENGMFFLVQESAGGAYGVLNRQAAPGLSFGLAQGITVNGVATSQPINAIPLFCNEQASLTPLEQVSIFLSNYSGNGVIIGPPPGQACLVTLTGQNPSATVAFDPERNIFYPVDETPSI